MENKIYHKEIDGCDVIINDTDDVYMVKIKDGRRLIYSFFVDIRSVLRNERMPYQYVYKDKKSVEFVKIPPYKAGKSEIAFTQIPSIPDGSSGYIGHLDNENGLFFEWNEKKEIKIVVRKDGVDYKQEIQEFINNCK